MKNKTKIKEYWDNQGKKFGTSDLATAPDHYYRDFEIEKIASYLKNGARVLDVGCGNGYSTFKWAKRFPKSRFIGIDYSKKLIEQANKVKGFKNVFFHEEDVLSLKTIKSFSKFDFVISERCIINLSSWEEQQKAILNMKEVLNPDGRIILCENTIDGLKRLNTLRKKLSLPEIKVRWHNLYLSEKKLDNFLIENFGFNFGFTKKNIGSTYYLMSRVLYAKLASLKNQEPKYNNIINKIAAELPSVGDYSPNYIYELRNREEGGGEGIDAP